MTRVKYSNCLANFLQRNPITNVLLCQMIYNSISIPTAPLYQKGTHLFKSYSTLKKNQLCQTLILVSLNGKPTRHQVHTSCRIKTYRVNISARIYVQTYDKNIYYVEMHCTRKKIIYYVFFPFTRHTGDFCVFMAD